MNFDEIKCKFCGTVIRVASGSKEVTCSSCYKTFNIEEVNNEIPVNNNSNNQSTNLPNPFASMASENVEVNINQPAPMNNMNSFNQFPSTPNIGNSNINNQNVMNNNMMNNNVQPTIPVVPNNNVEPVTIGVHNIPKQEPSVPNIQSIPSVPNVQNVPNIPNIQVQQNNPQVVPTYSEPINNRPTEPVPQIQTPPMNINNNNQNKKKKNNNSKILKIFLYIFFVGVIIASGVIFYLDYNKPVEEPEIYEQLPSEIVVKEKEKIDTKVDEFVLSLAPDVNFPHEREYYNNPEIVGRLEIPGLFNVLVTKGSDNSFYLNHDIYKKSDIRGTEFLDFRILPTSKQLNIYGHNTRDANIKVAFLKLEKFLNKEFFDNNQYVIFQHDSGKAAYKIVAIKEIRSNNLEHMIVDKTGPAFVEHVKNMTTGEGVINSREVHYDENSNIIVLQTCSHHWDDAFYTVIAVKVKDL